MITSQNFDLAYKKLNPEQKLAVDSIEGAVMVLAGPGTGKTQVLAMRIGKILLETQVSPSNILCLTYTETGAFEMRQRLIEILGKDGYYVRVHTFHSFCNEIISDNPDRFLNLSGVEPLDDVERLRLFQSIVDELPATSVLRPFGSQYFYIKDLISAISDLKRENISVSDYRKIVDETKVFIEKAKIPFENYLSLTPKERTVEQGNTLQKKIQSIGSAKFLNTYIDKLFQIHSEDKTQTALKDDLKKFYENTSDRLIKQEELTLVYEKYQNLLKENSRFDFEDLLLRVSQKLDEDKLLLSRYQEQFQYILVDEFQDTNGAQNKILKQLGSFFSDPNIFVVGDDDQSIYRFQGASLENILDFWHSFGKTAKIISLSINYRSTQLILDSSSAVIENNQTRVETYLPKSEKKLVATRTGEDKILECEFEWDREENYYIATEVKKLLNEKIPAKEIAVIFRNNSDSANFVEIFLQMQIPFKLYSGKNLLNDPHVLQLIRLLTVINDFSASNELFFVLHSDFLNFSPTDVAKINLFGKDNLFQKIGDKDLLESAKISDINSFVEFQHKLADWQKLSSNVTFEDFFVQLINQSGYLSYSLLHEEKLRKLNSLNTLFEEVKRLNKLNHKLTLNDFLDHLKILQENDLVLEENPLETDSNAVSLLTAHKSKGLEYSHVFITKLLDKKWGNTIDRAKLKLPLGLIKNQIVGQEVANEDERRLFYVAMTRAKQRIYLTYALKNESDRQRVPSMFLHEVSEKYLHKNISETVATDSLNYFQTMFSLQSQQKQQIDKEWIKEILKDYKLSVTHLNNYLECPRLWYFQNLLRVPAVKDKNASFGSAVHYTLRDLFVKYFEGKDTNEATLLLWFKKYLEREVLIQKDFDSALEFGEMHLAEYFNFHKDKFIKAGQVEYDFSGHGVNVQNIPITGKLDKIEILSAKDKTVNVVDYKTGNPDSVKRLENYKRQIVFYQLLCDLSPRFDYKMVSGELDYIQRSKKTKEFVKQHFEVTDQNKTELEAQIVKMHEEIMSLSFLEFSKEKVCGECEYCKFFNNTK